MHAVIESLIRLGPLPAAGLAAAPELEARAELLARIEKPVSDDEARALVRLFGPDDCFGLAWTLLHAIETSPGWPVEGALDGLAGEWIDTLRERGARPGHPSRDAFAISRLPLVRRLWPFHPAGDDGPLVWLLQFDNAACTPGSFVQAGIDCPPSVARSVVKRQAEFLCGRLAAREAMRHLGVEAWADAVRIGPSREPLWPRGVVGSLSHTVDLAAAAVLPADSAGGLGIDLERVLGDESREAVLHLSLDAAELALLERSGPAAGLDERITLAFSAKESLFKAAFPSVGRFFDFSAARLSAWDEPAARLTLTIAESLGGGYDVGRACDIHFARPCPGVVLTLCVA